MGQHARAFLLATASARSASCRRLDLHRRHQTDVHSAGNQRLWPGPVHQTARTIWTAAVVQIIAKTKRGAACAAVVQFSGIDFA